MTVSPDIQTQPTPAAPPAPRRHFIHVPTPGDHYSPATGSAVITVIHGFTKPHVRAGLPGTILVSRGTTAGYPPYPDGETREIDLPVILPSRRQKMVDALLGRLFLTRPAAAGLYRCIPEALGRDFAGTLMIHNAPAAIPLLRKQLPNAYVALYAHNQLFNTYSRREVRHVLRHADAFLCVSNFIAQDIISRAGESSPKIKVVLNGVDTDMFAPSNEIENPKSKIENPQPPVILFLGRVLASKGPHLLLQAAAKIATPSRPFSIRIIGSSNFNAHDPLSPYEQYLRQLARPLQDRVTFSPFIPRSQIVAQFRQSHIYVVPSDWDDPCPLTVLEGLACGMPLIVSNRGGIPEEARDAALYFSPSDNDQFAAHLAMLIDNPPLRAAYAARARRRAQQLAWPLVYQNLCAALA